MFAAIEQVEPKGICYLAIRRAEQPEFQLLLHLADGVDNPLPSIPRVARFRQQMAAWALVTPTPKPTVLLGQYRMLD